MSFARYFGEVRSELRQVVWPAGDVVVHRTKLVLATLALVAVLLVGLDGVLGRGVLELLRLGS